MRALDFGQLRSKLPLIAHDFYAYMPIHNYIFAPSREPWPGSSVDARLKPIPLVDAAGIPYSTKKENRKKSGQHMARSEQTSRANDLGTRSADDDPRPLGI